MVDYIEDDVNIFDDIHWFNGIYGYFPVYNISFLIAFIIYNKFNLKDKTCIEIKDILKEIIFKYGNELSTEELMRSIGIIDFKSEYIEAVNRLRNM